ncbi:hypothetical protein HNR19_004372 [Nocardioides thalensis]|uniref:Uncharacterized protein n=1 Tax=Nocardioides thalensis TaxID=1914755 RepID=A0A853C7Y3_9ACTN|nr:hypothetical protein [Nocardioides thalensis]NYJ03674.1 hypothetical protein [Nocardioides thalensis]
MTWNETHRRWRALREIETWLGEAARGDRPVTLPWSEEYAELFGDRAGLLTLLRYRLKLARDAQLDPDLPEAVIEELRPRLLERTRGVLRVLDSMAAAEQGGDRVVA